MKKFEHPVIEIMNLSVEDVITTSSTEPTIPAVIPPCA